MNLIRRGWKEMSRAGMEWVGKTNQLLHSSLIPTPTSQIPMIKTNCKSIDWVSESDAKPENKIAA